MLDPEETAKHKKGKALQKFFSAMKKCYHLNVIIIMTVFIEEI